jgi:hypothetical protein
MRRDIWIFLFFLGSILFGWPFLRIFHQSLTYYLFIAWLTFIGLLFLASLLSDRGDGGN